MYMEARLCSAADRIQRSLFFVCFFSARSPCFASSEPVLCVTAMTFPSSPLHRLSWGVLMTCGFIALFKDHPVYAFMVISTHPLAQWGRPVSLVSVQAVPDF